MEFCSKLNLTSSSHVCQMQNSHFSWVPYSAYLPTSISDYENIPESDEAQTLEAVVCSSCKGSGKIPLLTSIAKCLDCEPEPCKES